MDKNSFEKGKMKKKIYINPFFITTGAPCKDAPVCIAVMLFYIIVGLS